MAVNQSPMTPTNQKPGPYERYPLVMHRGAHPNIESRKAMSAEDEAAATENGWSTVRPAMPEPEPEKPVLTLEERVAALEEQMATKYKRGK